MASRLEDWRQAAAGGTACTPTASRQFGPFLLNIIRHAAKQSLKFGRWPESELTSYGDSSWLKLGMRQGWYHISQRSTALTLYHRAMNV
jgi:hypothetical protein